MKNKLNHSPSIIMALALLCILPSCSAYVKKEPEPVAALVPVYTDYTMATIIKYEVDGCNWMIQLEDGNRLEPVNLANEFKKESLKIWVQYLPYKNYSFCMAGEMVTINKILIRE